MTSKDNGGPAFPLQIIGPDFPPGYSGMTMRDWFAGQVLASCARHWIVEARASDDEIAKWAYEVADAMLAERSE